MSGTARSRNYSENGHSRSAIAYIGGKSQLIDNIVPLITYAAQAYSLDHYYEWCGGGARMLLNLPITLFESRWYNEADLGLCQLFACLGHKQYLYELQDMLESWGYGREVFGNVIRARSSNGVLSVVEGAACAYVMAMQSYAANGTSYDVSLDTSKKRQKRYLHRIAELDQFYETLAGVMVTQGDVLECLEQSRGNGDALVYLDPPYVPTETILGAHYGDRSWTVDDHERLVDQLLHTAMYVVLSGYDNSCYSRLEEAGWRKVYLKNVYVSSGTISKIRRDEFVWINFDIPSSLEEQVSQFDYTEW